MGASARCLGQPGLIPPACCHRLQATHGAATKKGAATGTLFKFSIPKDQSWLAAEETSTDTPGPMVEDSEIFCR